MTEDRAVYNAEKEQLIVDTFDAINKANRLMKERIESIERQQNGAESPVMLRIADALEKLARCVADDGQGLAVYNWQQGDLR
jgi:signal transduction histidine kinase